MGRGEGCGPALVLGGAVARVGFAKHDAVAST